MKKDKRGVPVLLRKGGAHKKSNAAKRKRDKAALRKSLLKDDD